MKNVPVPFFSSWDALNRLTAIVYTSGTYAGTHTEFAYDGLSRRTQIVERAGTTIGSGTVSSTKNYLWIGSEMAEERDASNTVTKRFFPQGEQQSGTDYYYFFDHLGSVRELMDGSGTIVARYGYNPNGVTTLISGSDLATFGFAGMQKHPESGLDFTRGGDGISTGRPYNAFLAQFPSPDPMGEAGGINLYSYCGNDPTNEVDPMGLYAAWLNAMQDAADATGGLADSATGGLSAVVRDLISPDSVNKCSGLYAAGGWAGFGISIILPGGGEVKAIRAAEAGPTLVRPYIRNYVRDAVEDAAPKAEDGRFIDPNTGLPTDNPVLGHKTGFEFWRLKAGAEQEGLSQAEFNEVLNDPELYQIEDRASNASHAFEQPK